MELHSQKRLHRLHMMKVTSRLFTETQSVLHVGCRSYTLPSWDMTAAIRWLTLRHSCHNCAAVCRRPTTQSTPQSSTNNKGHQTSWSAHQTGTLALLLCLSSLVSGCVIVTVCCVLEKVPLSPISRDDSPPASRSTEGLVVLPVTTNCWSHLSISLTLWLASCFTVL